MHALIEFAVALLGNNNSREFSVVGFQMVFGSAYVLFGRKVPSIAGCRLTFVRLVDVSVCRCGWFQLATGEVLRS